MSRLLGFTRREGKGSPECVIRDGSKNPMSPWLLLIESRTGDEDLGDSGGRGRKEKHSVAELEMRGVRVMQTGEGRTASYSVSCAKRKRSAWAEEYSVQRAEKGYVYISISLARRESRHVS